MFVLITLSYSRTWTLNTNKYLSIYIFKKALAFSINNIRYRTSKEVLQYKSATFVSVQIKVYQEQKNLKEKILTINIDLLLAVNFH